jgi:hypothetical protein
VCVCVCEKELCTRQWNMRAIVMVMTTVKGIGLVLYIYKFTRNVYLIVRSR